MKTFPSLIFYIIAENKKAILKMVAASPPYFSSPSTPGVMRAGIHGWHTFAVEWHVREPFAGVLEGRRDPPFAECRDSTEEGKALGSTLVTMATKRAFSSSLLTCVPEIPSSCDKQFDARQYRGRQKGSP